MGSVSSGIVLSGGESKRFGAEKALVSVENKPLIQYVLDVITSLVDETLVVVKTSEQGARIREACKGPFVLVYDESRVSSPLAGTLTGARKARGNVCLLLACDTPLLSSNVLSLLLDLGCSYEAIIPKWPNGNIEPLQAVYDTGKIREAAAEAIEAKERRMYDAIKRLGKVLYFSTEILKVLDSNLETFENINTLEDLGRVSGLLKSRWRV
jgi:molybdopterin-guanine dinucleotide biosynthesis protein A